MNRQIRYIAATVMFVAVVLVILCLQNYIQLGRQIQDMESQLAESRANWEAIAEKKENLQEELKSKQDELREAEQSLSESSEKSKEINMEIEQLRHDIDVLRQASD